MEASRRQQWIADNILPFEPEVRHWLRRNWRVLQYDADDVIQEAYARLSAIDLETIRNGRTFFYSIVRRIVQDQLRHARVVQIESVSELDALQIEGDPGPERWMITRERLERLASVVQALPPQRRAVFIARRVEGLSVLEIAQKYGLAAKTVENHLTFALAQVSAGMYGYEEASNQTIEREDRERRAKRD